MRYELNLPYPVSANRYWRTAVVNGRVRTYRSKDANDYRKVVAWIAKENGLKAHDGDFKIALELHQRLTKAKTASRVCLDIDNAIKVALDALQGFLYKNDNQVIEIHAKYGKPKDRGGLTIIAENLTIKAQREAENDHH
ncbi:Crossover junction endodeoxyribonuclease RusA [Oligella sp. MSHR50489EDL]|uniref:RusA family crossover junction endodeoxyribonuclease n=1 Tax=Oligella sp. MSHR50489EDL TaxID=3139409 RepID=UPI003D81743C